MVTFLTPQFKASVDRFKSYFKGSQIANFGQFYVAESIRAAIEQVISDTVQSTAEGIFSADKGEQITSALWPHIDGIPFDNIDVPAVNDILDRYDQGDLGAIRQMFTTAAPTAADAAAVANAFNVLWTSPSSPGLDSIFVTGSPTVKLGKAAQALEKTKCFPVALGMAQKLARKQGTAYLAADKRISMGTITGAVVTEGPAGPKPALARQTINYTNDAVLVKLTGSMRAAIDAGATVLCGVLSGVRQDKNLFTQPEHYILVFGYGVINGVDAFVFWDPDALHSNVASAATGPGFGWLFHLPGRLATGLDEADLKAIERNPSSATFGDHLQEPRRHCYQVYYIRTLPQ